MTTILLLAAALLPFTGQGPWPDADPSPAQEGEIVVSILFDNYAADQRFGIGWGFAALIETDGHTILFDTGADGEVLLENFRLLGKDPAAVESVVISHAHGDHTGGVQALLDLGIEPRFLLLSGFPAGQIEDLARTHEVVMASPGQEIASGIRTTGQVDGPIPEQALILGTDGGIVVLTGCAHPGVVQMIDRARDLSPEPVAAVMGGFHLMAATGGAVQGVLGEFQRLGVARAGPTHCSGEDTMAAFQEAYGEDFILLGSGRVMRFRTPGNG